MNEDKGMTEKNPLKSLWNMIMVGLSILGAASILDDIMGNLLHWKGLIASAMQAYHSVSAPISEFLFGWLPWSLPLLITNYLILGIY